MKAEEIKGLTTEELQENLSEKKVALHKMKINHKVAASENPIEIRKIRRNIAQLKTELRSRELQANK